MSSLSSESPAVNAAGTSWHDLCDSHYGKVIFCDLYHKSDSVGCRFEITDNVHEDPCDYIGLFKIGYESLSQCLASKMLSETQCEDDGKLLHCSFKTTDLPPLDGFYQFLYVTRDDEICGASMPFGTKQANKKESSSSSDEDVVADKSEGDFLLVRSNLSDKNKQLQSVVEKLHVQNKALENELTVNRKQFNEEKCQLNEELRILAEEKDNNLMKYDMEVVKMKAVSRAAEGKIVAFERRVDLLVNELKDANIKIIELDKARKELEQDHVNELKDIMNKVANLEKAKKEAQQENVFLMDCKASLERNIEKMQVNEKKRISSAEKEKAMDLACLYEKHKGLQNSIDVLTRQLEDCRKQNDELMKNTDSKHNSESDDKSLLLSQLEDSQLMVQALEDSKLLVLDELALLSNTVAQLKEKLKEVKCENFALKLKFQDIEAESNMLREKFREAKSENFAMKLRLNDAGSANEQVTSDCTLRPFGKKKESKRKAILKKRVKHLSENLHGDNFYITNMLSESCKREERMQQLIKEKEYFQNCNSTLNDALKDALSRLNDAAVIYKKQFLENEKLKRKLKRQNSKVKCLSQIQSVLSCSTATETKGELSENSIELSLNQTSDSDTGEHVVENLCQKENTIESVGSGDQENLETSEISTNNIVFETPCEKDCSTPDLCDPKLQPGTSHSLKSNERFSPQLETMIEKNLASLSSKASQPEEEVMFSIPCPVCDQDIGIFLSSSDEMLKHLEVQHLQQMCPVCGKLFDMTLPGKYLQYHMDDHFMENANKM